MTLLLAAQKLTLKEKGKFKSLSLPSWDTLNM